MSDGQSAQPFPVRFTGRLRPAQVDAVKIAEAQLAKGKRRIHIVAPPGSGKTVLGLYLWSECVQKPALVLSPNSAIQAQWASRTSLFEVSPEAPGGVSTDSKAPGLLTSLTYQSVTLPERGGADLDGAAIELWKETLIAKGQAENPDEAAVWIEDLRRHNADYYDERLSAYRKQVRDRLAISGNSLETLHASSLATLHRLRDRGVGLVILDECHHLMGHWGRVLSDARELLEQPVVIGLTATPPDRDGKPPEDVKRYDEFFGPIDYEVPVPAVVKDGFLAPYQDLAYFVRPTTEELQYLATVDGEFHEVVQLLCGEFGAKGDGGLDFSQHICAEPPACLGRTRSARPGTSHGPDEGLDEFRATGSGAGADRSPVSANAGRQVAASRAAAGPGNPRSGDPAVGSARADPGSLHPPSASAERGSRRSRPGRAGDRQAALVGRSDYRNGAPGLRIARGPGDGLFHRQDRGPATDPRGRDERAGRLDPRRCDR